MLVNLVYLTFAWLEVRKNARMVTCPFSSLLPLTSFHFPPLPLYPFLVLGSPLQIQLEGLESTVNSTSRSGHSPADKVSGEFWVENHAPCNSSIAKVWYFSEQKWWYGFGPATEVPVQHTTHFQPCGFVNERSRML